MHNRLLHVVIAEKLLYNNFILICINSMHTASDLVGDITLLNNYGRLPEFLVCIHRPNLIKEEQSEKSHNRFRDTTYLDKQIRKTIGKFIKSSYKQKPICRL